MQPLKKTTLTGYFQVCAAELEAPLTAEALGTDPETHELFPRATDLTYLDFPSFYTWDAAKKKWSRRKRPHKSDTIGRIYSAHPSSGERFYLRMLLCKVAGATSWAYLRTVNGVLKPTFKDACYTLGLLADDTEWVECLTEAESTMGPGHLRDLFVHILIHNQPTQPLSLWDLQLTNGFYLKMAMSEDFHRQRCQRLNNQQLPFDDSDYNLCLYTLDDSLQSLTNNRNTIQTFGLPAPSQPRPEQVDPLQSAILYEQFYDTNEQERIWTNSYALFNPDQKYVFDTINAAVKNHTGECFFVDALAGTGKTFVINALLAKWRQNNLIAPAVATSISAIAAILLAGGKTAHSRFGIPLQLFSTSSSNVTSRSAAGKMLLAADVIIWDEATMASKDAAELVDRLMRNLTGNMDLPFGGKMVVFLGDFRQTLPVVPRQGRNGIVAKILKNSIFWPCVTTLHLRINKRVRRNSNTAVARQFSYFLANFGNGDISYHPEVGPNIIQLPEHLIFQSDDLADFIRWCYPDIAGHLDLLQISSKFSI